jgi:NADPH2:quinone reductase
MQAIRVSEYGGPEVLRLQEVEVPVPEPGEVCVRLRAAGPRAMARRDGKGRE